MGQGASRRARVGRVRSLGFLSILQGVFRLSQTCRLSKFHWAHIVFPQPLVYFPQHGLSRFEVQFGDRPQSFLSMLLHDHASGQFDGG